MYKKKGFMLIELLVVIVIIALLMAVLMPALGRVNKQAKAVVCQSNLRHWALIFQMYLDDNEGKFSGGEAGSNGFVEHDWIYYLKPYFTNYDMLLCPTTTKSWKDGWVRRIIALDWMAPQECLAECYYYPIYYGSYGKNSWCSPRNHGLDPTGGAWNWRTYSLVKRGNTIPLLLDANILEGFPVPEDEPPPYSGELNISGREMGRYCLDRHNGFVNALFLDWSVRKVALKELWKLKWHRQFNINGPWTIAGFGGDATACAAIWDEAAPWMSKFPEY